MLSAIKQTIAYLVSFVYSTDKADDASLPVCRIHPG